MNKHEKLLYDYIIEATNGDTWQITGGLRERLLHPSLCVLDAVYASRLPYDRIDNGCLGTGLIHNYLDYVESDGKVKIRPARGSSLEEGQREDTLDHLHDLLITVGPDKFGPTVLGEYGYKMPGTNILKSVGCFNLVNWLLGQDARTSNHKGLEDYSRRLDLTSKPWEAPELKGIGEETFHYFLMLAGNENLVKIDIWLWTLVPSIIGDGQHSREYIEQLIINVAGELGVTPKALDNWLWRHARNQAPGRDVA